MARKKKRPRTERRSLARTSEKLADAREKLAHLSPGGAPERPIDVVSASVVELTALELGCARCEGELRLEAHDASSGLRRVEARCKRCGATRETWLRIAERLLS